MTQEVVTIPNHGEIGLIYLFGCIFLFHYYST